MTSLSTILLWKFGSQFDAYADPPEYFNTGQADPKDMSAHPKMVITEWRHKSIPQPSENDILQYTKEYEKHIEREDLIAEEINLVRKKKDKADHEEAVQRLKDKGKLEE